MVKFYIKNKMVQKAEKINSEKCGQVKTAVVKKEGQSEEIRLKTLTNQRKETVG